MPLNFLNNGYFAGTVGIGTNSPFSPLQVGQATFTGANGMVNDSRVGISNHGILTGMMLASTYNDATYPEYGLVFVQGPSTSSYNVWSISPDGPAKGSGLSFIYKADATNIHNQTPQVYFEGSTGYVGIGTSSPGAKLEIKDGDLWLNGATSNYNPEIFFIDDAGPTGIAGAKIRYENNNGNLYFDHKWDTATSGFFFRNRVDGTALDTMSLVDGNVGIGTTSPDFKLDVDGTFGVSDLPFNTDSVSVLVADETLGPELVTNGNFDSATGWNLNSNWTISGGTCNADGTSNNDINQNQNVGVIGEKYRISYVISAYTQGTISARIGSGVTDLSTGTGTFTQEVTATTTDRIRMNITGSFIGSVDSLSIKQITSASNQIQKRELGTGAFGPTPVGAYLPLAGGTMTGAGSIDMPDGFKLLLGNGIFSIFNDGTYSIIRSANEPLLIDSNGITFRGYSPYNTLATITSSGISVKSALLSNQENTDVDTGTETVANVAIATYTAAFFDFVIKKTTNVRSGTVYACHDGTNVEFTETSTQDLGDTSDVTLSVDISGGNMRLLATVTSDDWSVKSLIRAI